MHRHAPHIRLIEASSAVLDGPCLGLAAPAVAPLAPLHCGEALVPVVRMPVFHPQEMVDTINLQYPPEIVQYYSPNYAPWSNPRKRPGPRMAAGRRGHPFATERLVDEVMMK